MDAAFGIGAGGNIAAFPLFGEHTHAVVPAQAEELALQIVIDGKAVVAAGGVEYPVSDIYKIQKAAEFLLTQFNLHGAFLQSVWVALIIT